MSIHAKMLEFHKRFRGAQKTGYNTHFKQPYFKLEDIHNAVTPLLNELGLIVFHSIFEGGLVTKIIDVETGDMIESRFPLPDSQNPQVIGSSLTYGQRYNVAGLLCIAEEDDDGEAAAINQPKGASMETLAALKDHLEAMADDLTPEQVAFFDAHPVDRMTEDQARKILNKLKQKEAA